MDFFEILRNDAFHGESMLSTKNLTQDNDVCGWMHAEFPNVFKALLSERYEKEGRPIDILEIGTWQGKSACCMATFAKMLEIPVRIICVDTWLGAPEFWTWGLNDPERGTALEKYHGYPQVYHTFLANVKKCGHTDVIAPFPISSTQAADVFSYYKMKFDLIYIDASHEFSAVTADMHSFWPLLRPHGFMFGDDYDNFWEGVKKAVNTFSSDYDIETTVQGVIWQFQKNDSLKP